MTHKTKLLDSSVESVLPNLNLSCLSGARIFVTGGTGFFGVWLLTALRVLYAKGVEVKVCVLSRDPESFLARNPQFRNATWLNWIAGNIRDFKFPNARFDLILHAATDTSKSAHADQINIFDDIVLGTRNVLNLAKLCRVKRILLISSGAVYGQQPPNLTKQPDSSALACDPWAINSAYGEGKRVMELMGAILAKSTEIECFSARCFAFSGPGIPLDGHFAIGNFVRDAIRGHKIVINGNGLAKRSYLHGADLAIWLLYLLLKARSGVSYNVGSDQEISIRDLAFLVRRIIAPDSEIIVMDDDETVASSNQNYVPSITRARRLGCKPWTSLPESLALMYKYSSM